MRYGLIGVAVGAFVLLTWLSLVFLERELRPAPPFNPEHPNIVWPSEDDYTLVVVLATAALVMVAAAGGMIARRAEGAYLLSVGALMAALRSQPCRCSDSWRGT